MDQAGGVHPPLCAWTRAHLGWRDLDGDEAYDPIDSAPYPPGNSFGTTMILENSEDPIVPGDRIVVRSASGAFVRSRAVSEDNPLQYDAGVLAWDGVNYKGQRAPIGTYSWYRDGVYGGSASLEVDEEGPTLANVAVVVNRPVNGSRALRFTMQDADTRGCNVRVNTYPALPPGQRSYLTRKVFDRFRLGGEEPIEFEIPMSEDGNYFLDLFVWDFGGGHGVEGHSRFLVGPTASTEAEGRLDGTVGGARPNPSGGMVQWSLIGVEKGAIRGARVFTAGGRLIRELQGGSVVEDESVIWWDGRDGVGRAVPAGKYFMEVTLRDGRRLARPVVVAR